MCVCESDDGGNYELIITMPMVPLVNFGWGRGSLWPWGGESG